MKRYLAFSAILASSLFAASDAQIMDYFKGQIADPNVKVEIKERTKVKEHKDYEVVTLKIGADGKFQELKLFAKDGLLFPDIIDIKNKKSLLKELEAQAQNEKIKAVYSKENQDYIISLGNDPKKETLVIFTDPECPYCRNELLQIEDRLKEHNVKMLLTPVHGRSSLEKSYLIYEGVKSLKDDKEKIALMRKYYDKDVDISKEKVSDDNVKDMEDLRGRYVGSVIRGVPFLVGEKDIK